MIIDFHNGGGSSGGGVTSGQVENMITSALTEVTPAAVSYNQNEGWLELYGSQISKEYLKDYVGEVVDADILADMYLMYNLYTGHTSPYQLLMPWDSNLTVQLVHMDDPNTTGGTIQFADYTSDKIITLSVNENSSEIEAAYSSISNAIINGGGSGNIVTLTQQEYEALTTKDPDTLYVISDATPIDLADYAMNSAVTALQASKADAQTVSAVTGTSSPYYFPIWNNQGVITGQKNDAIYPKSFSINGISNTGFLRNSNTNPTGFYAPTAAGTAGQMLMSAGSGAPTWTTYKFAFLTQTEYDALTTPDSTTFYFITGD